MILLIMNSDNRVGPQCLCYGVNMSKIFIMVALVFLACDANARNLTIRGKISIGNIDSVIVSLYPECCTFLTKSNIARKIFQVCGFENECEVVCRVDENNVVKSVSRVRKIDTEYEPPALIIKEAACWVCGLSSSGCKWLYGYSTVDITKIYSIINNKVVVWVVDFVLVYKESFDSEPGRVDRNTVYIVKRNGSWHYARSAAECVE